MDCKSNSRTPQSHKSSLLLYVWHVNKQGGRIQFISFFILPAN